MLTLSLLLALAAPPTFNLEISQSNRPQNKKPVVKGGKTVHDLKRRSFTLRFSTKTADHYRVYVTFNEADTRRPDKEIFCGGCGMADARGNEEWGLIVPKKAPDEPFGHGFNYLFFTDAKNHRCDPEPTPSKTRCWRTIYRLTDTEITKLKHERVYLVVATGTTDEDYEFTATQREVHELRFPALKAKKRP